MGPAIPRQITLFIVSVVVVTIMGAASRNCGSVLAARGQACIALAPLIVASVCQPDVFERFFAGAFGALFVAVLTHAHQARVQTVRFLEVSEENRKLAAELGRTNAELVAANVALAHAASTDGLTGVANRRSFDSAILNEVRRARRECSALSLFMIDVDHFKQYNDRYGHLAGDDVLARVAAQLSALLRRPADFVARYGGEEFVAVLPQTDGAAAFRMAEELRARIEALDIPTSPGCGGRLTVSIGVTTSVPGQGDEAADFIRSADTALYAAKSSGRNCVRVGPSVARTRSADEEAVCLVAPRA
jgi:diguanylate cyclase (GGDEF)-like protein